MAEKPKSSTSYYRKLVRNMFVIILVISFIPMIMIGTILNHLFQASYKQKVMDHLYETVIKHKQNIDTFLLEKLIDLRVLANSYTIRELQDEHFLENMLQLLQREHKGVFVDIGIVNSSGIQTSYVGPFRLNRAVYSDEEWFKIAIQRSHYISDVFLGLRGLPHFIVCVNTKWNDKTWIVRSTIDFVAFNSLVENIQIGKTGLAFIINKAGEFQTKPRVRPDPQPDFFTRFLPESPDALNERDDIELEKDLPADSNILQTYEDNTIITEKKGSSGYKFLYVMTPFKTGEWLLVYQQSVEDAFAELIYAKHWALAIFIIGGLSIIVMAMYLSRKMVDNIKRADIEKDMMTDQVIQAGKLVSIGELAAGIAHEISNPVAIMVEEAGWIEDLLEESPVNQDETLNEIQESLQQINIQGKRCKEITHKLLYFARKTDPIMKETDINELIGEIMTLSSQRAKYSNVSLIKNLDPSVPSIVVSPSELQQVFLNLINNAMDAMDEKGGTVTIKTRAEDDNLYIDVADTGSGIPKANFQRIFDPFFTTKAVGKGTGLGLSICYGIINKYGGEITVSSVVGTGTVFHIRIPLPSKAKND